MGPRARKLADPLLRTASLEIRFQVRRLPSEASAPNAMSVAATKHLVRHAFSLGRLMTGLQAVECAMREYLLAVQSGGRGSVRPGRWSLRVGDVVDVDAFTSHASLRALIDAFNAAVRARGLPETIDPTIAALRDVVVHGRVSASKPDLSDYTILKFGPEHNKKVRVTESTTMDVAWFDRAITRVREETLKVQRAYGMLEASRP
jgi:hypothetical protein